MAPATGAHIIANSLRSLGVSTIFGIVGIPVIEIAEEARKVGIQFIGFRNEQAASYAATAYGYLTGKPGVCLVVGGPGVLHAIAGVSEDAYPSKDMSLETHQLSNRSATPVPMRGLYFCSLDRVRLIWSLEAHFKSWTLYRYSRPIPSLLQDLQASTPYKTRLRTLTERHGMVDRAQHSWIYPPT